MQNDASVCAQVAHGDVSARDPQRLTPNLQPSTLNSTTLNPEPQILPPQLLACLLAQVCRGIEQRKYAYVCAQVALGEVSARVGRIIVQLTLIKVYLRCQVLCSMTIWIRPLLFILQMFAESFCRTKIKELNLQGRRASVQLLGRGGTLEAPFLYFQKLLAQAGGFRNGPKGFCVRCGHQ